MRGPHARGEAVTTDVGKTEDQISSSLFDDEEIRRQVPHSKDFACNFKDSALDEAWRAEPSVNLRSLEYRRVKIRIIPLECCDLHFKIELTLRASFCSV